jgi:D-sedoheptulose 7-phosphate isomerase
VNNSISDHFKESAELISSSADLLGAAINDAAQLMVQTIIQGNKILACGNGGSAADAQHFAAELMGRFEKERHPLPAIALTTDTSFLTAVSNDYGYERVFARQVQGLGHAGDILLALSTSGNSTSILLAAETAKALGMRIVALTGRGGGELAGILDSSDCHVCVPHDRTARIQEVHGLIIHCLCSAIDHYGDWMPEQDK